ncbi:hypothetical protein [Candidatus Nitrosocaldus cavascurensis]|jgi:hypothetical protein|nr:hypothetical protein [Candidatus Nitrosocaldus cavascurensis]
MSKRKRNKSKGKEKEKEKKEEVGAYSSIATATVSGNTLPHLLQ